MTKSSTAPGDSAKKLDEQLEGRRDLVWALVFCLIAVVVVRSFLFEPFKIPSSSMVPTLRIGDYIFVSKFSYSLVLPMTKLEIVRTGTPKRGDVIVFLFPRDESLHYIKRVVGVPGDLVEFKGKDLIINGKTVPKKRVTDPGEIQRITGSREMTGELYEEILGDVHYVKYSKATTDFPRRTAPEVVPENQFFVAGDNRDDSYDSRSWGYVPRENLKGKAQIIWLSIDDEAKWGLDKFRWNRSGTAIR